MAQSFLQKGWATVAASRSRSEVLTSSTVGVNRRQFLEMLGIATGAALVPASVHQGVVAQDAAPGQFNGGWPYQVPPTGHFNHFVPNAIILGLYQELINPALCFYLWAEDSYVPILAESWEFVGEATFNVTLAPNLVWDDGASLTVNDVIATFTAARLYSSDLFEYVDSVQALDDRTVSFHMSQPSSVVERYVLRTPIRSHAVYGQFTDRAAELYAQGMTNDSPEIQAILGEFGEFRPDSWPSSGPYRLDRQTMNEASCELVRNPSGTNGEVVNFERILLYNGEVPVITPLVLSREVDYVTHGMTEPTNRQMDELGIRVLRTPAHFGGAMHINYAEPRLRILSDKRVRQAIAHAVVREQNAAAALGRSGIPVRYMSGVPDSIIEQWLTAEELARLNPYPFDQNRATKLLEAAGCTRDGELWRDPDGNPMEYECLVPTEFFDQAGSGQDVADQLAPFGIRIVVRSVTFTQIPVERREGRFQLAYDGWGTGNPHPHFSFVASLLSKVQPLAGGPYTSFNLEQQTESVGAINFRNLITRSALGLDVEQQKDDILKASLAFNELLPVIPFFERLMNGPALEGVRVTGWPADGDPIYQNSAYNDNYTAIMLWDGTLQPV